MLSVLPEIALGLGPTLATTAVVAALTLGQLVGSVLGAPW